MSLEIMNHLNDISLPRIQAAIEKAEITITAAETLMAI